MTTTDLTNLRNLPSVDEVLRTPTADEAVEQYGRQAVVNAVRQSLAAARTAGAVPAGAQATAADALLRLETGARPNLKPVFNLTGTVLHTNLGRALVAEAAIEAAVSAMRHAVDLEFDLETGRRGERDDHLRGLLCELTGAEDATVLNTLAKGRQTVVSRGELIEIGGAFRLPEIMGRAGTKLVEIGTTNRTHLRDYADAIGAKTGLLLKVHPSNYRIEGFTAEVAARDLATLAHDHGIPLVHDLGSGALIDPRRFGLAREPTVAEALAAGADLVTFSGDKLLGGPQAGFIAGRRQHILALSRNPMKRALRVDKVRLAALEATLRLYRDPERLAERLPTVRLLAKPAKDIRDLAERLRLPVSEAVGTAFSVEVTGCSSQIGSGALPLDSLPSAGLAIRPVAARGQGRVLADLAAKLRALPVPVVGRLDDQALVLDLRCLDDDVGFVRNLAGLGP